jgi:hypothetical protein
MKHRFYDLYFCKFSTSEATFQSTNFFKSGPNYDSPCFRATETVFTGPQTQDRLLVFWPCLTFWPCFCSQLAEISNFSLDAVFFCAWFSHLHKSSSPGLRHGTDFWGSVLRFCNLLLQLSNFGLGAVYLSCLSSKLQNLPSMVLKPRTTFRSSDLRMFSFWSQGTVMKRLVQTGGSVLELEENPSI